MIQQIIKESSCYTLSNQLKQWTMSRHVTSCNSMSFCVKLCYVLLCMRCIALSPKIPMPITRHLYILLRQRRPESMLWGEKHHESTSWWTWVHDADIYNSTNRPTVITRDLFPAQITDVIRPLWVCHGQTGPLAARITTVTSCTQWLVLNMSLD